MRWRKKWSYLYRGEFDKVNGVPRANAAALDASGKLLDWAPNPDGVVQSVLVEGDSVYLGGGFKTVSGQPRIGLAKIGLDGALSEQLATSPAPLGVSTEMAVVNNVIYFCHGSGNALRAADIDSGKVLWENSFPLFNR